MDQKHPTVLHLVPETSPFHPNNVRDYGEVMNECGGEKGCGAALVDKTKHIDWHRRTSVLLTF